MKRRTKSPCPLVRVQLCCRGPAIQQGFPGLILSKRIKSQENTRYGII